MVVLTRNIDLSVGSIVGLPRLSLGRHARQPSRRCRSIVVALIAIGDRARLRPRQRPARRRRHASRRSSPRSATLAIYRGLAFEITGGREHLAFQLPDRFLRPRLAKPLGVPTLAWIALVVALVGARSPALGAVGAGLLRDRLEPRGRPASPASRSGRRVMHRVRDLRRARRARRLHVRRRASPTSTRSPRTGFELDVITAVVIGGVNVFGGSGTMLGVVLGARSRRDDPRRLHAAQDLRVLEDLLQRASRSSSR